MKYGEVRSALMVELSCCPAVLVGPGLASGDDVCQSGGVSVCQGGVCLSE